jgi:hypothetical protein
MSRLRPAGSGSDATGAPFLRATASPTAALVLRVASPLPTDWPVTSDLDAADSQLGHALGWVCEIGAEHVVLINPLGEGAYRAPLPALSDAWLHDVRSSASAAIYLLDGDLDGEPDLDDPAAAVNARAAGGAVIAASVRTAISAAYGKPEPVGRNDPCPCGSGRKYKHCHLK